MATTNTKLIPTRFRFYRSISWGLTFVFAVVWITLPPTGEPFMRAYRAITIKDPLCNICNRPAAGTIAYGTRGEYKVSYCSYHLANAPNAITFVAGRDSSNGSLTFFWGFLSLLFFCLIAAENFFPALDFRFRRGTYDDTEPYVQVFDSHTGVSLVQLYSPSPYTVRGDPSAIAYLNRVKPASMSLPDYIFKKMHEN